MGKTTDYINRGKEHVKKRSELGKRELRARGTRKLKTLIDGRKRR